MVQERRASRAVYVDRNLRRVRAHQRVHACPLIFVIAACSSEHNQELAASRRQLNELREAKDEEAGKFDFELKKLKADLDIANQKAKVMQCKPERQGDAVHSLVGC